MKALIVKLSLLSCTVLLFSFGQAQEDWPKTITAADGTTIKIYQPQPESFSGNTLKSRSAISVSENGNADPVFGTFWSTSKVQTDRDTRQMIIESIKVTDIKIPVVTDQNKIDFVRTTLEYQFPDAAGQISLDEVLTSLDQNLEQAKLSNNINNNPPKVIFTTQPTMLALIDGAPKLQRNNDWGVDVVVNSPFTIVKNNDGQFYLYGAHHWYAAPAATGPYSFTGDNVPQNLHNIESSLNSNAAANNNNAANNNSSANGDAATNDNTIANIVVSTTPTELIQSKGEPNFSPIEGTALLYVKNSDNDIFMDVNSQQYYVLISGRWFKSKVLNSNDWQYIPADKLPPDFAKIPEGSPKDNVLASVAGTDAANEAVMDAQIPQTAKVDRNTATTTVTYNGDPQFESINGTKLQYAVNTSSTVLRYKGQYYAVDNGVWFVSDNPSGPWVVATERPDDVDLIPPSSPAYNTKYVYVYDVTPDYVYMGYTPGYLNSYVYGPTVVYGTGFYYDPWFGSYYYPRPWSWGFNYCYTPWYGWGFGFGYNWGWFNVGFGYSWGGWRGGWWGPGIYHPAYWGGWHGGPRPYSFYGRNNIGYNRGNYINVNNNIYRNRNGIATRNNTRFGSGNGRPTSNRPEFANGGGNNNRPRPNNADGQFNRGYQPNGNRPTNSVFSDRQGNVYQRGGQGQWQQRENRQWRPVTGSSQPDVIRNLNRQQQMRDRGEVRAQNFERARPSSFGGGGGYSRPSGGGSVSRPSGGGGGGGGRSSGGSSGGGRSGRR